MSWSLQAGGHGDRGSATVYMPNRQPEYITNEPLEVLFDKVLAALQLSAEEEKQREAAVKAATQEQKG